MSNSPAENISDDSHANVRLVMARRVHEVCRRFETDWRSVRQAEADAANTLRPQLHTYFVGVDELERSALLAELLALECELRSSLCGELPNEAEYLQAFPADASLIEDVFRQWRDASGVQPSDGDPLPPARPPRLPKVEGYDILKVLGRGGMGVVYKARHRRLKRLVALKMILSGHFAGAEQLSRFRAEAETVARLQHPNIIQIFDIDEQDGNPFLTFELIEGATLAEFARDGPLPPRIAAELVETLAQAIHYAHQKGVVHRDLKPANVLLAGNAPKSIRTIESDTASDNREPTLSLDARSAAPLPSTSTPIPSDAGTSRPTSNSAGAAQLQRQARGQVQRQATLAGLVPKITDFGLAKDLDSIAEHTQTGTVLGTAQYMSPEQAAGRVRDIGPASDIYSLGAILYLLLTGRPPLQGTTPIGTVRMVIESEPMAPAQLQPRLPKDLETICLKCLRKQPGQRYASAEELAEDLHRFRQGKPIVARPVGRIERAVKWARRRPSLSAFLVVTVIAIAGVVWKYLDAEQHRNNAEYWRTLAEARQSRADRNEHAAASPLAAQPGGLLQPETPAGVHNQALTTESMPEREVNLAMTFVRLPKGSFYMGWDGEQKGVKTEITEDFEIAVHEITQSQWKAVMGTNPSQHTRIGNKRQMVKDVSDQELKRFPVEMVSYDDIQLFIGKLNDREQGSGWLYRLPSSAEWEYACRGGATSEEKCSFHFYFGEPTDDLSSQQANFNGELPFGQAPKGPRLQRPSQVGTYPPNKLGLYDMHANVWEWCSDLDKSGVIGLLRGGGFGHEAAECRAANLHPIFRAARYDHHGFRLVRSRDSNN